jgi:hypothetical protein
MKVGGGGVAGKEQKEKKKGKGKRERTNRKSRFFYLFFFYLPVQFYRNKYQFTTFSFLAKINSSAKHNKQLREEINPDSKKSVIQA